MLLKVLMCQLKSVERTLAGALRREQMAETSIKELKAENEQLNRLVFTLFVLFPPEFPSCRKTLLNFLTLFFLRFGKERKKPEVLE